MFKKGDKIIVVKTHKFWTACKVGDVFTYKFHDSNLGLHHTYELGEFGFFTSEIRLLTPLEKAML